MSSYMAMPVLDGVQEGIFEMYDEGILTREQTIKVLNLIRDKLESYNTNNNRTTSCRCGRCLKVIDTKERYSLENEINKITGGSWWNEEIDKEVISDGICYECCQLIVKKYILDVMTK